MSRLTVIAMRMFIIIIVIVALGAGGGALILKKKHALAQSPKYKASSTLIDTATAYLGDLSESHDYLAVVDPVQTAKITARVTATIETLSVNEGSSVTQGQLLMTLDHRQIDSQLLAVGAQIRQAEADLQGNLSTVVSLEQSLAFQTREVDRASNLAKQGTIAKAQAEAVVEKKNEAEGELAAARQKSNALKQLVQSLQARLGELKTTLSYCQIESPFVGVVTSRLVDPGDQAAPGKTLLMIETTGAMMIAFDVPQTDLPAVKPGLSASFKTNGETRDVVITRLYPSLNRARMMRAEIILSREQASDLTSGQYLTLTVVFKRREQTTLIPVSALIESTLDRSHVFVVKGDQLEAREISVQGTACELAAVEGIEPGEEVVVGSFLGWARLSDGMKVETK